MARSNPSSVGPAICGYAVTIIPKPRIPMPVARSDIQLIFSSRTSCCIIVGHMIYYPKLDYSGFNVSCKWLELTLHWKIGYSEGQNDENLPEGGIDDIQPNGEESIIILWEWERESSIYIYGPPRLQWKKALLLHEHNKDA
jgi:hypothetical protein